MPRSLPITALMLALLMSSSVALARDPGFAAQTRCKAKPLCAELLVHLRRLKKASKGTSKAAFKARFIRGSLLGYEALRAGDSRLAARSIEVLKSVVAHAGSRRYADDSLLLMARLRALRGAKRRAASTLQTLICDYGDGDMVDRAKKLRKQWRLADKPCRPGVSKQPKHSSATAPKHSSATAPKHSSATAPKHSSVTAKKDDLIPQKQAAKKSPAADLGLGAVTASGGDLSASLRRVRRIVIDPGHGGDDPGAVGHGGVHEADLAYALSVSVAHELRSRGYQVLMTRSAKQGRSLRQRTEYANRHQADLFISIHLNAAKRRAYGFEVYYLDVGANRYARRLAARENRQSEEEVDALQYILADLATKGNAADSRGLATSLTDAVHGFRSNRKKEIRSALFAVLLGARMPAVLIEAGFVTDGDDVKRLNSSKRRQATAAFLADGIDAFAKKLAKDRR